MPAKSQPREVMIECIDCGVRSPLKGRIELGQEVACPECGAWMEIVSLDPIAVDWVYDEPEDDEDEDDE